MTRTHQTALRHRLTTAENRLAQAEFIGWPRLAESFRRELAALQQQLPAKEPGGLRKEGP